MSPEHGSPERPEMTRRPLRVAAESEPSEEHENLNEDAFFADPETGSFGILDGMSHPSGGEIAARVARQKLLQELQAIPAQADDEQVEMLMAKAFEAANQVVLEQQSKLDKSIGTTATVVKITRNEYRQTAVVGHIGDSRACRWRPVYGTIEPLTLDHTVVSEKPYPAEHLMKNQKRLAAVSNISELSESQVHDLRRQNILTRALGHGSEAEIVSVDVYTGDKIILTSDGIHDNLTDQEIAAIIAETASPEEATRRLVAASKERTHAKDATGKRQHLRAKPDDMTALVIEIGT